MTQIKRKENVSMIYDKERKKLKRIIATTKPGEDTKFEINLDETGIINVWNALLNDVYDGNRAITKQEELLDSYEKQANETPKVPLDKRLQQLKTDLILLQKRQEWDKHNERITQTKETIKHIKEQLKQKHELLYDLQKKCSSIEFRIPDKYKKYFKDETIN